MHQILKDFIYVSDDALSKESCDRIISNIDNYISLPHFNGEVIRGSDSNGDLNRQDLQIFMPSDMIDGFEEIINCAFDGLSELSKTMFSCNMATLVSPVAKLQKTEVSGGFHNWHIEQGGGTTSNRFLVWMIYLNDVDEGGHTEFIFQGRSVQPKTGRLVIWPAGVTHPHRGNPPYSNTKYVATGWFELPANEIYNKGIELLKESSK